MTLLLAAAGLAAMPQSPDSPGTPAGLRPGRTLVDAHNAYPERGRHADRLERALAVGMPVAIEQDLCWYFDPETGRGRSVVSHGGPYDGSEPSLEEHFFARVAPQLERALTDPSTRADWPLVVLNLDIKSDGDHIEHHRAIWQVLEKHRRLLTTAKKSADASPTPFTPGPLLVLTGSSDAQEQTFRNDLPDGGELLLFGAVHPQLEEYAPPAVKSALDGLPWPEPRTDYRRWWNHPWSVIEDGGQSRAAEWTPDDAQRLRTITRRAHNASLFIRFYTLDGADREEMLRQGWTPGYSFLSRQAVETRWKAARAAGVDFIATDEYEALGRVLGARE